MILLKTLNKTGQWTTLLLLLFIGLSPYPAFGRPPFQDEDEDVVLDEDHDEDFHQLDDENELQVDDEDVENDPSTTPDPVQQQCEEEAKKETDEKRKRDYIRLCLETARAAINKRRGGGGGGGTTGGGAVSTDEYDD